MSREHPLPTPATIKQLYGTAYRCAFPRCRRTLYKVDAETGSRTLNSRVAHICARSEGGPRWDAEMNAADNQSVANLLLLCIEHAAEVDEPSRQEDFKPETLREWKRLQLEDFDKLAQGWVLSDQEAEEAIPRSIRIEHSTVSLGGAGGNAPGAGGGGGGAIGPGALGGAGGPGGHLGVVGQDASAPGAGGGGGGALGQHAAGGEGGGGGETATATFDAAELPDHLEILVGQPGRGGVGGDGEDGGDTVVRDPRTGAELLRARGGRAGRGASEPVSTRPATGNEVPARDAHEGDRAPTVSALVLANSAERRDGLLYALGAGWDHYRVQGFPARIAGAVVFVVDYVPDAPGHSEDFTVELVDPNGTPLSVEREVAMAGPPGRIARSAEIVPFCIDVSGPGRWSAQIRWRSLTLASVRFEVRGQEPSGAVGR